MFEPREDVAERYTSSLHHRFAAHGTHSKIIQYVGVNKRILDVGCGSGYLDKQFKKNGCHVVGIEIDVKAGTMARKYCEKVIIGDIEDTERLPYPKESFDVIVFGDVLEHFRRPDLVLAKLRRYLSASGFVIASIPNIAYAPIRLKLLMGNFDYEEFGHLDKTHLRFFTLKTIRRLFTESGYKILKMDYTGPASMIRIAPTLTAMHFIVMAKELRADEKQSISALKK